MDIYYYKKFVNHNDLKVTIKIAQLKNDNNEIKIVNNEMDQNQMIELHEKKVI